VPQRTVDVRTRRAATLKLTGRHDPCIAVRAVPVVRACVALALADAVLVGRSQGVEGTQP
jgi:chorismate synthase